MILLDLFFSFFKIGLFAIGGGLATLPFLYELANTHSFITIEDVSNLIAVSESTPGPMGVNMATYVGFLQSGITGSIVATLGLIAPSIIIIEIISGFLKKFKENKAVKSIFYGLRACSCALICVAGLGVCRIAFAGKEITDVFLPGIILGVVLFFMMKKFRLHPVIYIALSALVGIIFKFNP